MTASAVIIFSKEKASKDHFCTMCLLQEISYDKKLLKKFEELKILSEKTNDLEKTMKLRLTAQYSVDVISEKEAIKSLNEAQEFLTQTAKLLEKV